MKFTLKALNRDHDEIEVVDFMTIGSDKSCHIHFSESQIEERHFRIEFRNNLPFLKDLRSRTGTWLNDIKTEDSILNHNDIIKMGEVELQFIDKALATQFPLKSKNVVWNTELLSLGSGSKSDFPILILGSSGTGKEVLAKAIHESSKRKNGPLISVNCSALTETLVESELFGHVKGSFTGAIQDRKGAFESARGGTLFLDEIGDLSYTLQAKLLRALENNEIRPVGSDKTIQTDVRIIAATHQNLLEKIREGSFRFDLYYRLNVIQVTPPDLINRMEDFDLLLGEFCRHYRVRFNFNGISLLKKYSWPGNIRELKNLIARASALYPSQQITESLVEKLLDKPIKKNTDEETQENTSTLPVIKEIERQMIIKRLKVNKGNQRLTANDLGMPKSTLHDRLKYYDIDVKTFKIYK
ncbi:MAG: sigma 54-interacting transcriptional regulator [Deltaproteobacteria bacterium]|jgi:transcriptional regulator with PAS, ATPase and Fis domain|nr:sigma 54-interacting transcriptional regulator [Deltaproteobacteria bacterium]